MSFYEQNLECMKQKKSNLFNKFKEAGILSLNEPDEITSRLATNGEQILVINKNNREFRLNSSYNPQYEAERWVEQFAFLNFNIVITMYGLGNGIFINEILRKKNESDVLLIYEPSPAIFLFALKNYDLTDIINNESVVLAVEGINDFEFHNMLQNAVALANITSQIHCMHPYYQEIFPESCIKFWKEIKENYMHTKIGINTEILLGKRFIINGLNNVNYLKDSNTLLSIKNIIQKDIPAIVVAAGPSLKSNIEELKRAKGKSYIFVVDRILDYVLDNGLEPDFVVTLDPIKPIEYFTTRKNLKIPLLSELESNWQVLEAHKGKKIFYSCNPFFVSMYNSVNKVPPLLITGSSVATAAFSICLQLGFERIVLVGQDLAYDGEFTHAGGVAEKFKNGIDMQVEGVDGNLVRSRFDWNEFLTWFNDVIKLHPKIEVIDTKDKGAKIQGTKMMQLKEVNDTYCIKDNKLENALTTIQPDFTDDDMIKINEFLEKEFIELKNLKKKVKKAINLCNSQLEAYKVYDGETKATIRNGKKISEINNEISTKPIYLLLDTFITSTSAQQISELYKLSDDNNYNKLDTYKKSIVIYNAVIEAVKYAEPLFTKTLETMKADTK